MICLTHFLSSWTSFFHSFKSNTFEGSLHRLFYIPPPQKILPYNDRKDLILFTDLWFKLCNSVLLGIFIPCFSCFHMEGLQLDQLFRPFSPPSFTPYHCMRKYVFRIVNLFKVAGHSWQSAFSFLLFGSGGLWRWYVLVPLSGQALLLRWGGTKSAQHCQEGVVNSGVKAHDTHQVTHLTNIFCLPDCPMSLSVSSKLTRGRILLTGSLQNSIS